MQFLANKKEKNSFKIVFYIKKLLSLIRQTTKKMETETKEKKTKRPGWKYMQLEVPAQLWKKIAYHRDNRMVGKDARITLASLNLIKEGIEAVEKRDVQNVTE